MQPIQNQFLFSKRATNIPRSFIREILKVTAQPEVISFAGGLPNPAFFPIEEIKKATIKVLEEDGANVLQYGVSEGYLPLRQYLAHRYQSKGLEISADQILITNGSQQGLDLIGKIFIDPGDKVLMERPSYLGAIQAFSAYEPDFVSVELMEDGIDLEEFENIFKQHSIKLFYTIPNFQNPTGITCSYEKRLEIAKILKANNAIMVEDDPYGEIRFSENDLPPIKKYLGDQGILLGSFSKIISPGMRLGWIVAAQEIIEKLLIAKQAADLHSNYLSQRIIHQYLMDNDLESHLGLIRRAYTFQKSSMIQFIQEYFPKKVKFTQPTGGMFIWVQLPKDLSSFQLLNIVAQEKITFVPGEIFYTDRAMKNTFRLNFSNSSVEEMEKGIKKIGEILHNLIN